MFTTVYLLVPVTETAENWIDDNLQVESWQKLGKGVGVGHRYIGKIVEGMQSAGLVIDKDFRVES